MLTPNSLIEAQEIIYDNSKVTSPLHPYQVYIQEVNLLPIGNGFERPSPIFGRQWLHYVYAC